MKYLREIAIAVIVIAAISVIADKCSQMENAAWADRVNRLQGEHRVTVERITEELRREHERRARTDSLVDEAESHAPVIRERIDSIRSSTPDSIAAHPAVVERDSIIDDQQEQIGRWRTAFRQEREANDRLMGLLEEARADADSLSAVLEDRPGEKPWYIPNIGVGPHVGVCTDGQPCSGLGAHLSWKVSL